MADKAAEVRFHSTSGRFMAVVALVLAAVVVVVAVADPGAVPGVVVAGVVLGGVLAWASMLWPALSVNADHLVMRSIFETVRLPLAAIEELAVRQVLAVRVGERRYVSPVVGRSWRKSFVGDLPRGQKRPERPLTEIAYPDYVEQELRQRMEDARAAAGVSLLSDAQVALAQQVRREPAWLPIGLLSAAVLALVVAILL